MNKSNLHDDHFVIAIDSTGIKVLIEASGLDINGMSKEDI